MKSTEIILKIIQDPSRYLVREDVRLLYYYFKGFSISKGFDWEAMEFEHAFNAWLGSRFRMPNLTWIKIVENLSVKGKQSPYALFCELFSNFSKDFVTSNRTDQPLTKCTTFKNYELLTGIVERPYMYLEKLDLEHLFHLYQGFVFGKRLFGGYGEEEAKFDLTFTQWLSGKFGRTDDNWSRTIIDESIRSGADAYSRFVELYQEFWQWRQ